MSEQLQNPTVTTEDPSQLPRYRRAFEETANERNAVAENDFVAITLDVPAAVFTLLGAWPKIQALRPQFAQYLPGFDMARFDKMEAYALALMRANTEYKTATEPPASLVDLANQAIETRRVLLADLNALIARGLVAESVLDALQGVNGHKNVVVDITTLADILKKNAGKFGGRSSVTAEEIYAAENLADQLGTAIGLREQSPHLIAEAVRARNAAFTLFITAYDEIRAAVGYLRRKEGDADTIAPTLYTGRGPGKKKPVDEAAHKPGAPTPATNTGNASGPVTNAHAEDARKSDISENGPFM